ncbi:MAG: CAP domain-containing protein [Bdellovibrionales bacterium]|nr:CAP domain-containing protein [Bdellovibrionales bacterium]
MKFCLLLLLVLTCACEKNNNTTWAEFNEKMGNEPGASFIADYMLLVNNHRKSLGLVPLIHDTGLAVIAKSHSSEMANGESSFGHTGFSERCAEAKLVLGGGNLCSENVAMGQKTPALVFTSWMGSSGHRANIEQSRSTHTGFGYKQNDYGIYYWTQIFIELD